MGPPVVEHGIAAKKPHLKLFAHSVCVCSHRQHTHNPVRGSQPLCPSTGPRMRSSGPVDRRTSLFQPLLKQLDSIEIKKFCFSMKASTSWIFRNYSRLGIFTSFTGKPCKLLTFWENIAFTWQHNCHESQLQCVTLFSFAGSHPRCHRCCSVHHHVSDLRDPGSWGRRPHCRRGQSLSNKCVVTFVLPLCYC